MTTRFGRKKAQQVAQQLACEDRLYYRRPKSGYEVWLRYDYYTVRRREPIRLAYTLDKKHFIGSPATAHFLTNTLKLAKLQPARRCGRTCAVGFSKKEQKWYGWSHRARCAFGIGDRIFEELYGDDKTPYVKHGRKKIKTLADAKLAARRFAMCVA